MKISCSVARDLLPLYQERLLSDASAAAVEAHLKDCAPCQEALARMQTQQNEPLAPVMPLGVVGRKLRRSNWRRTAMVAALLLFAVTIPFYHATKREYIPYSPELVQVEKTGEGRVQITAAGVNGVWSQVDVPPQQGWASGRYDGTTLYLSFFKSGILPPQSSTTFTSTFEEVGALRVYYVYPGHAAVLLYGPETGEGVMLLPRLALNYYWRLAAIAAAGIAALLVLFRKRERARRALAALLCLPLCYVLAHFAVKGMDFTSWDMLRDWLFILAAWAFLSAGALLWLRQRQKG